MKRFLAAVRFLTIIKVPGSRGTDERTMAGATFYFPVVGLLIGGLGAGAACVFSAVLPPFPVAVLTVTVLLTASGGLHMDGFADCADGFLSCRPREQILEIMRDSRIGAMGVMAVVLVLAIKISSLASIQPRNLWQPVLLMPVAGRSAILVKMALLPYARPEGGLGGLFYAPNSKAKAIWSLLFLAACSWMAAGPAGLEAAASAVCAVLLFSFWSFRKIGGSTGDTLGAAGELAEAVTALAFVALSV